jgi:hypothetical protein
MCGEHPECAAFGTRRAHARTARVNKSNPAAGPGTGYNEIRQRITIR